MRRFQGHHLQVTHVTREATSCENSKNVLCLLLSGKLLGILYFCGEGEQTLPGGHFGHCQGSSKTIS